MVRTLSTDTCISLRWFQYRIIHRIYGTYSFLYKIRVINSNLCTFVTKLFYIYFGHVRNPFTPVGTPGV